MANLPELAEWTAGIYQLEEEDPVLGGENGIDNLQAKQLANRTLWLKALVELAAPRASPVFTGTPTAPTASLGDNSLKLANTAFVQATIAALVASSPAALDTLNELAAALGNDPNFATTVTNAIAGKQPLDATLTALAALTTAANKLIYATGADSFATTDITALARTLLAAETAADARTALGAISSEAARQIQPIEVAMNTPSANAMSITIHPTSMDFRASTLSSGMPNRRNWLTPLVLTVPVGATLGAEAGQPCCLVPLILDNAGTMEPAVINLAGGVDLSETGLISTTAISASADFANVCYSAVARSNVPYRVAGCAESTQAVPGNWATPPTLVQGVGGQALAALHSFGYGQRWVDQTGSRTLNTTLRNTTKRPRLVSVVTNGAATVSATGVVDGLTVSTTNALSNLPALLQLFVPPGSTYRVNTAASLLSWHELG